MHIYGSDGTWFSERPVPCGLEAEKAKQGILGNLRVKTPIVRLVNQVPLLQQKKELYRKNLQDDNFILRQRIAGVGLFFSLTSTDKCCCRRKRGCKTTGSMLFCKVGKPAKME